MNRSRPGFGRVSQRERRNADLFFAELVGTASPLPPESSSETAPYDPRFKALELSPSSAHGGTRMAAPVTSAMLTAIMPKLATASAVVQRRYLDLTNDTFRLFAIDTIESRAFFLAHAFIESGQFSVMMEGDLRTPYRARERGASDPTWRPRHVTGAQDREYKKRNYHRRKSIAPGGAGDYRYIGRGPLQVTTFLGYKRAAQVMGVWGQELGRRGAIQDSARILHAQAEVLRDPYLAAIPEIAFLHSGAHFKAARRPGRNELSMDKSATSAPPFTWLRFLSASGSMFGVGSVAQLKKFSVSSQRHVIDNLNAKLPVFHRAVRTLCGSQTSGVCSNSALSGPVGPAPFPLP